MLFLCWRQYVLSSLSQYKYGLISSIFNAMSDQLNPLSYQVLVSPTIPDTAQMFSVQGKVGSLVIYLFNTKFCLSISSQLSITHLSNIGWWLCSHCPSENYWSVITRGLLISDLHTLSRIFTLSDSSNSSPNTHHREGHYLHNGILMPTHTGSVGWREGREKFI